MTPKNVLRASAGVAATPQLSSIAKKLNPRNTPPRSQRRGSRGPPDELASRVETEKWSTSTWNLDRRASLNDGCEHDDDGGDDHCENDRDSDDGDDDCEDDDDNDE